MNDYQHSSLVLCHHKKKNLRGTPLRKQKENNHMIKHVGRHNEQKVAIVFKTLPNDPAHALVVYSDTLPTFMHDGLMNILESKNGQAANDLSVELDKHTLADGRNILQA